MRARFWALGVVVFVVCFLLLLWRADMLNQPTSVETRPIATNEMEYPLNQDREENRQNAAVVATTAPPSLAASSALLEDSNAVNSQLLANWQAPIEFYGKVVDQEGNPVPDADIQFGWMELPAEDGSRSSTTQSDAEGLFSLRGARGPSLNVSVSKADYYTSHEKHPAFKYGYFALPGYSPDPQKPVIYHLRKEGSGELLVTKKFPSGMGQVVQLRGNGTPVEVDLLNGKSSGQLRLEFWRNPADAALPKFNWKCQLSVPGGGIVATDEEFAFQAPDSGYQTSVFIDMPAANQDWQGEVRNRYYVHLPDGKYGRLDFCLLPYNGVFTVESAINPSGSRNLEPSN